MTRRLIVCPNKLKARMDTCRITIDWDSMVKQVFVSLHP